ncbi:MAG TPA: tetratricopeptide repeat protein [Thiolapillus brandeum]|uniref:protein O-GlcNAc transferase n=1 Tax=Thiolapillus brandeum TaxID=1076588 RepID=A0A831RUJ2_9GAMM|nr:tetratricopeptide repeat protein [Thiolapillus brandeum]
MVSSTRPGGPGALRALRKRASAHLKAGRLAEAQALYVSLCKERPADTESWLALARINRRLGNFRDSEYCARQVLSNQPASYPALVEYGAAVYMQGRVDEAMAAYGRAIDVEPGGAEAHYYLATAYLESGRKGAATEHYRRTLESMPTHVGALNNLSTILTDNGRIKESLDLLEKALKIRPNTQQMMVNQARTLLHAGDAGGAAEMLEKAVRICPGAADVRSKYLLCLNYLPDPDPERIYREHIKWEGMHVKKSRAYTFSDKAPDPGRRLNIGYVSPDLKRHPVSSFIEPLLELHDKSRFAVTCYADVVKPDETSRRLQALSDNWRWTSRLTDDQLCEQIREDRIDILVDLAGHTANNRLGVFARKPAPLSVTYLGYPNTTGLAAVDYRFTDAVADPPGLTDCYYTEELVRLDRGFLCYKPPEDSPPVSRSVGETDSVMFGSFNNLAKVTPAVIGAWARILSEVSGSRLLLKSRATSDPYVRGRISALFAAHGISSDRLIYQNHLARVSDHLSAYAGMDIALDTFPYNGTTTTCEALWMGVPVISLCGEVHASRVGASLLGQVGLDRLVASDIDSYVGLAVALAGDKIGRQELRDNLRSAVRQSSLCDAGAFARKVENAFGKMWESYVEGYPY